MSIDHSLKIKGALSRHRNVLSRAERIEILKDKEEWEEGKNSIFGLPKVAHRKSHAGKKEAKPQAEQAAEGVAAPEAKPETESAGKTQKAVKPAS